MLFPCAVFKETGQVKERKVVVPAETEEREYNDDDDWYAHIETSA